MRSFVLIGVTAILASAVWATLAGGETKPIRQESSQQQTYQGKTIRWWADRTVKARREANASALEVKQLRRTLKHSPSVREAVEIATTAYPELTQSRAWCIIGHESKGYVYARNRSAVWNGEHATGLFQFLPSTFHSTPYGKYSIYSPYAQAMAAGYAHKMGWGFGHGGWTWTCR